MSINVTRSWRCHCHQYTKINNNTRNAQCLVSVELESWHLPFQNYKQHFWFSANYSSKLTPFEVGKANGFSLNKYSIHQQIFQNIKSFAHLHSFRQIISLHFRLPQTNFFSFFSTHAVSLSTGLDKTLRPGTKSKTANNQLKGHKYMYVKLIR